MCNTCDIEKERKREGKSYHLICPECGLPVGENEKSLCDNCHHSINPVEDACYECYTNNFKSFTAK